MERGKDFLELQRLWYDKLKESGFKEIEETHLKDRPLKAWHSYIFTQEETKFKREILSEYQTQVEKFLSRSDIEDIWVSMVSHYNNKINLPQAKIAVQLHLEGWSQREIARHLNKSKTCIHLLLQKFKQWMKVL